ncbi:hypothetical protein BSN85_35400 [Bradyrhizobium brasilense]|uniref:methyltransferase domain-containing protein n=1 Tax=Bradyrhizobium brasilense TaxID=1419277 RepID=UPI0009781BB8|nr:hypothetical protein BSN85_35400 [Bradyrhizobium brasilense]
MLARSRSDRTRCRHRPVRSDGRTAKQRLDTERNITFAVENGQALSFTDNSFDALICSLGLMLFPDPSRG